MVRQTAKRSTALGEQGEDVLFLLSCIRSRQNALIFFLQLFAMANCQKLTPEQYNVYKQEFLQKQKINTHQIRIVIDKLATNPLNTTQTKTFWMKLKSIIRVSLERARTLGMLIPSLETCYENIVKSIDSFYTAASTLQQYLLIQQLVKRRTIEALMATKHTLLDHPSQEFGKIRSETFLKGCLKPETLVFSPTMGYSPAHTNVNSHIKEKALVSMQELLVIRQQRKGKRKDKGKSKDNKKIRSNIAKMERKLADVMQIRLDCYIDKKKAGNDSDTALYDTMFSRNIANHKIIAKYLHGCGRLAQRILQIKQRQRPQRRNLSHGKLTKKLVAETVCAHEMVKISSKVKLGRPKTSKPSAKKTLHVKGCSVRTQKISDLLRGM